MAEELIDKPTRRELIQQKVAERKRLLDEAQAELKQELEADTARQFRLLQQLCESGDLTYEFLVNHMDVLPSCAVKVAKPKA